MTKEIKQGKKKKKVDLSAERKRLQAEGVLPLWYTTAGWQMFKSKYLYQAANVKEQFQRIAFTAASHLPLVYKKEAEEKFFNMMWDGVLSCSTPVLSNTGTDRGLPVSCQGADFGDSVIEFFETRKDLAIHTKKGFGTSGYLGDVRPRGSPISTGGTAEGVLPLLTGMTDDNRYISQGNTRRGAFAGYTKLSGGDFDEIVDHVHAFPEDINIGWNVTEEEIQQIFSAKGLNREMKRRWAKSLKLKMNKGKGYYLKTTTANKYTTEAIRRAGRPIKASNLCVAPETLILTDRGYLTIEDVANTLINVWNGSEWSPVTPVKTGENQKLIKVKLSNGMELDCTEYHKFYVQDTYSKKSIREVRACDLKDGDKLVKLETALIEGSENLSKPYENGFYTGDGCFVNGNSRVYLYGEKKKLFDKFAGISNIYDQPKQDRIYFNVDGLMDKYFVPGANYTKESRIRWFEGLSDSDGTVSNNGTNKQLQIGTTNLQFAREVQLMLQTLGVQSKVTEMRQEGLYDMPANDGEGGKKEYFCQTSYRILVDSVSLYELVRMGYNPSRLSVKSEKPQRHAAHFVTVSSVTDSGRISDTYCFTEPKRNLGVFNGILTGNCSEIMLPSDEEYNFVCVLSSMNLIHWDRLKVSDDIFWATVFLACINKEFISKAKGVRGLEKSVKFAEDYAAVGLGALGFHSLLQKSRLPFGSFEAHMLNNEIFDRIEEESERANRWLAEVLGENKFTEGLGVHCAAVRAIAPTKSTANLMAGMSEGINPDASMVFLQSTAAGEVYRINPFLLEIMKERGAYTQAEVDRIGALGGTVQSCDWLTDHEKLVFLTAYEINMLDHLRLCSQRQRRIDQGQSINLFLPGDADPAWIMKVHKYAMLDEYIKSLYYIYSTRMIQGLNKECQACS